MLMRLLEAGCEVTAGVINIGDTDQEAAESLGIEYVEDAPFSPISEAAEEANMEFIGRADGVVVADLPFGMGNLANLRSAIRAMDMGKAVAIIGGEETFPQRDFAEGKVQSALKALIGQGAAVLESPEEVTGWVAKSTGV